MNQGILNENISEMTGFYDMGVDLETLLQGVEKGACLEDVSEGEVVVRRRVLEHLGVED